MSSFALGVILVVSALGCSKPGDDSQAKRTPIPEPAPNALVPNAWSIPLEVDNAEVRTLDSSILQKTPPDFEDQDRHAWRLDKILSDSEFPLGSLIEAIGDDGVGISMRRQQSPGAPVPVLVLTRRGEIVAAAVKGSDPFPDYHGQGGRLRRPGDPFPRLLSPLARLRVSSKGTSHAPVAAPASIEALQIQIGESPATVISKSVLASLPSSTVVGDSGNSKTVWNVRDIVSATAGEKAVLVEVQGEDTVTIDATMWANTALQPVLQMNRRGQLKYEWTQGAGNAKPENSVHSVRVLKVRR